jgi:hypothetical protein
MLAIRAADALWIDEAKSVDHRRELSLTKQLRTWFARNATGFREVFR